MANTKIRLNNSGATGNVPSTLQFGELALNYADDKLFYKRANSQIVAINLGQVGSSSDSFSTINVNSSLILATSATDTLSIVPGNNISITANTVSKTITINSTASGGSSLDQFARDTANSASSNTIYTQGVDVTQNTRITAVDSFAQSAYNKANTGTSVSLGGFAPNNVLTVNSAGYIANNANLNYYTSNNTLIVTGNIVGGGVRTTSSTTPPANAVVGDFWYKTDNDVLYRYTSDGTSAYWLDISGSSLTGSQLEINMISPFLMMGA